MIPNLNKNTQGEAKTHTRKNQGNGEEEKRQNRGKNWGEKRAEPKEKNHKRQKPNPGVEENIEPRV